MNGYRAACQILKASTEALERRIEMPDSGHWLLLAVLHNHESECRLEALIHDGRGAGLKAHPLLTEAAIVRAAIERLEGILLARATAAEASNERAAA